MSNTRSNRDAFSLLEVILALAILTSSIAILGELIRQATTNAKIARQLTMAQLLCESKLAEVTTGIMWPESVSGTSFESENELTDPEWLYSIDVMVIDEEGLLSVQVTVYQDLPPEMRPVEFSLTHWMIDPEADLSGAMAEGDSSGEALF